MIARGESIGGNDLQSFSDGAPGSGSSLAIDHSNYSPSKVSLTDTTVTDGGGNQSAFPAFVGATSGNFHQLPGRPRSTLGG